MFPLPGQCSRHPSTWNLSASSPSTFAYSALRLSEVPFLQNPSLASPPRRPTASELCARLCHDSHTSAPQPPSSHAPAATCPSEQPVSPTGLGSPEEGSVSVHPCMLSATCFGPGTQVLSKCVLNESSASFHLHRGEGWGKVVRRTGQPGQRGTQSKGHPLHSQFPGKLAHNNQLSPPASLSPQNLSRVLLFSSLAIGRLGPVNNHLRHYPPRGILFINI